MLHQASQLDSALKVTVFGRWVTLLVMSDNKASFGTVSRAITKVNDWIMFGLIYYFLRACKILRQLVEIVVRFDLTIESFNV